MFALSLPKGILKHIFMEKPSQSETSFWARLRTAFSCFTRALANPDSCRQAAELLRPSQPQASPKPVEMPPERVHASGLAVLSMLQREGSNTQLSQARSSDNAGGDGQALMPVAEHLPRQAFLGVAHVPAAALLKAVGFKRIFATPLCVPTHDARPGQQDDELKQGDQGRSRPRIRSLEFREGRQGSRGLRRRPPSLPKSSSAIGWARTPR